MQPVFNRLNVEAAGPTQADVKLAHSTACSPSKQAPTAAAPALALVAPMQPM